MRTRSASIATVVIAIGLALTTIGLARALPYTFGGVGDRTSVGSDLWAHGSAVSPPLVGLVALGLLALVGMRPTRGGRRAASWLAVLGAALAVAGLCEPAQQEAILLASPDAALTTLVIAFHAGLVSIVLAAIGDARRADPPTVSEAGTTNPPTPTPAAAPSAA